MDQKSMIRQFTKTYSQVIVKYVKRCLISFKLRDMQTYIKHIKMSYTY